MIQQRAARRHTERLAVGFAAGDDGRGVAYVLASRRNDAGRSAPLRVTFSCNVLPALRGRDVAYAALTAVANALLERGTVRAHLIVEDGRIADDLAERRTLPNALVMPYVALRCVLNRFGEARVGASDDPVVRDLTARARAEVALHVAA